MRFRPCIDIHNGKVKQIVGGSLIDAGDTADTNYESDRDSVYYSDLYFEKGLGGGHVILLNGKDSPFYEATKQAALNAVGRHKGFLQVGGGVDPHNAPEYLEAGASHVIVTSYVFHDGRIAYDRLKELVSVVGKERLVLDLSVREKDNSFFIVTDRWQKYTDTVLSVSLLEELSEYADEYLVHAADVEGRRAGISDRVLEILGSYSGIPVTYAGGISGMADIEKIRQAGKCRVDFTIGSALDIFGGPIKLDEVIKL